MCEPNLDTCPIGWHRSTYMGAAGFKCEANDFYDPNSTCYPIHDFSNLSNVSRLAWSKMCHTPFPCKPPTVHIPPAPPILPPDIGNTSYMSAIKDMIFLFSLGFSIGCSTSCCINRRNTSKSLDRSEAISSESDSSI